MQILKKLRTLLKTENQRRIEELQQQHKADQIVIRELQEMILANWEVMTEQNETIKDLSSSEQWKTINRLRANLYYYKNKQWTNTKK